MIPRTHLSVRGPCYHHGPQGPWWWRGTGNSYEISPPADIMVVEERKKEYARVSDMREAVTPVGKPSTILATGPNGETTKKYTRKLYWQCDLDPIKGVFLRQSKLAFSRTTTECAKGGGDTTGGEQTIETSKTSTSSEGQRN